MDKKFRYKKVTHREMVEDKVTPWTTQGYMEDNHRELMAEDQEMTPHETHRLGVFSSNETFERRLFLRTKKIFELFECLWGGRFAQHRYL